MIYMFCSCRELLGDKAKHYERSLQEICQRNEMGEYASNEEFEKEKEDLVNSYKFRRYCCKQRLMTYIRTVNIVK